MCDNISVRGGERGLRAAVVRVSFFSMWMYWSIRADSDLVISRRESFV